MSADDREVLMFLGWEGKSPEATSERFPDLDIVRLVRARLLEEQRLDLVEPHARGDVPPVFVRHYMLTRRGAEAIGIDPLRLNMARAVRAGNVRRSALG